MTSVSMKSICYGGTLGGPTLREISLDLKQIKRHTFGSGSVFKLSFQRDQAPHWWIKDRGVVAVDVKSVLCGGKLGGSF